MMLFAKARLICPECGHESPPTGDWVVTNQRYTCPTCGTVVTDRSLPEAACGRRSDVTSCPA